MRDHSPVPPESPSTNPAGPAVLRWVRTVPVIFFVVGMGFASWLSRLPAVRDATDATASEMSAYVFCLALGGLVGLTLSGRIVHRFTPRTSLLVASIAAAIALPGAAVLIVQRDTAPGLIVLFIYGVAFSICDVAMNVSGANAEAAFGKPRMPLMHAGYSLGAVAATGCGAAAEFFGVSVPLHLGVVTAVTTVLLIALLRNIPQDEYGARLRAAGGSPTAADPAAAQPVGDLGPDPVRSPATGPIPVIDSAAGQQPAFTTMTGSIPVQKPEASDAEAAAQMSSQPQQQEHAQDDAARLYSPWRDPRILLIGLITLSFGLFEGTASDWLPIALVDGRGVSNQFGSLMLSGFFAAVMAVRLVGSALLARFGRVAVLRVSAVIAAAGIATTVLVPSTVGLIIGVIAWGAGTSLGWPVAISAAADRIDTAARDVAAVSAVGYGAMLIGPMAFGLLGERIGLLVSFWALMPFAVYVIFAAAAARSRAGGSASHSSPPHTQP